MSDDERIPSGENIVKSLRIPAILLPQVEKVVKDHGFASANAFMVQAISDTVAKYERGEQGIDPRMVAAQALRRQALLQREVREKIDELLNLNEKLLGELSDKLAAALESASVPEQLKLGEEVETLLESSEAEISGGRRRHVMVNTNISNNAADHDYMLRKHRAAAFYSPWKEKIEKYLAPGDMVYLYQSGVGLVAYGRVDTQPQRKGLEGDPSQIEESYVDLVEFRVLKAPVAPSMIRKVMRYDIPFRHTLVRLPNTGGELLHQHVQMAK